ncbi:MAG: hypothetical protein ACFFFO_16045 [Candidatus Thorarchaeota archaeon]
MQFFDATLAYSAIAGGAVISSIIVGLILRWVYRNSETRVAKVTLIILGAFGVFSTIFAWSHILFGYPFMSPISGLVSIGYVILISIIFGVATTAGLNRKSEKE